MNFVVYTYLNNTVKKSVFDELSSINIGGTSHSTIRFDGLTQSYQVNLHALNHGEYNRVSVNPQIVVVYYDLQLDFNNTLVLQHKETYPIGRAGDNGFVLKTKQVSSKHAVLFYSESGWMLEDRGSTNGTYVNGNKIDQWLLQDGDTIHIAGWEFIYKEETIKLDFFTDKSLRKALWEHNFGKGGENFGER